MTSNPNGSKWVGRHRDGAATPSHPSSCSLRQLVSRGTGKLEICQSFNRKVTVAIPMNRSVNVPADNGDFVALAAACFSDCFGGCQVYAVMGFYQSQCYGLVREDVAVVKSYTTDEMLWKHFAKLEHLMVRLLVELGQETAFLSVDNEAILWRMPRSKSVVA